MAVRLYRAEENSTRMQRNAYAETMAVLMDENPDIVALDADLASSVNMAKVMEDRPGQSVNCGIAEANMISVAAGLSTTGKIPYAHTFAVFASRRVCDQIYMSACYAGANIRIIGSDPGIASSFNGGTHMPFADMAILRSMPEITLLEPTDCAMTEALIRELANRKGVFYVRLYRKYAPHIYSPDTTFEIGKAMTLREGSDVTLIAGGMMVAEALRAAEALDKENISARVLDMFTWKPLDEEVIRTAVRETGCIVTAENHSIVGGLGSAVAEVVCQTTPIPMEMVGVKDLFGEVGTEEWLKERFCLRAEDIAVAAKKVIGRKKDNKEGKVCKSS